MSKLGSAPMASSEHANAIPWRWIETTLTLHLGISQKNQHLNPASFRINIKRKGDECHLALPTTTLILRKAVHVIDIHFMRTHKQSAMNKFKARLTNFLPSFQPPLASLHPNFEPRLASLHANFQPRLASLHANFQPHVPNYLKIRLHFHLKNYLIG